MSSRPVDPSYTIRTWATDANYPVGANVWSAQPTKVEPPGPAGGFVPGQGGGAPYFNKLFSDAFAQDTSAKTKLQELYAFVGQTQALNFREKTVGPAAGSQNFAFFAKSSRKWYILANGEDVRSSADSGLSWAVETGVAVAGEGESPLRGDADNEGNVVLATNSNWVFELNAGTNTWSKAGSTGGGSVTTVHFDPVRAKWVYIYALGGGFGVRTSTNRTAWAAGTSIASPSWDGQAWGSACKRSNGRIAFGSIYNSTNVRFAYTDDAGTTWTIGAAIATTIVGATEASMSYNEDEDAWYFVVGETSGTPQSEVWRSTDGITWTKVCTAATVCIRHIGGLGALLVSVLSSTDVVFSLDSGATWHVAAIAVEGTPKGVYIGWNRPLVLTSSHSYVGDAMGFISAQITP